MPSDEKRWTMIPDMLCAEPKPLKPEIPGPVYSRDDIRGHTSEFTVAHLPDLPRSRLDEPTTAVLLFNHMKEQILSIPSFGQPFKLPPIRHRISSHGRYGLTVHAHEDIVPGELIMRERPLVAYPNVFVTKYLQAAVNTLSEVNQLYFNGLHNAYPTEDATYGIAKTNAFNIQSLPGYAEDYRAVFKHISRLNHCCSYNAVFRFDLISFTGEIRARRKIMKGEEITISYINPAYDYASREERRQELYTRYRFICQCRVCIFSDKDSEESDGIRRSIGQRLAHLERLLREHGDRELLEWCLTPPSNDDNALINSTHQLLTDMKMQRIYYPRAAGIFISRMCKLYCAKANVIEAVNWANQAAALCRAYEGHDGGWAAIAKKPTKTNYWNLKKLPRDVAVDKEMGF
ncbi:hypothetical protein QCA50_011386 [Cerrena zonata]|uniref:SET domain-containing protein n=1 Tax=Cerrena zonata TaxID=2478898 RepID=A0AAW0G326_9APHY